MIVKCFNCGKEIKRTISELKRSKSGKSFCSKSCSNTDSNRQKIGKKHPNYKLGTSSYRKAKLRASDLVCEGCGNSDHRVLEVHHKDHNRSNNELSNLSVLCANCHKIRHYEERNTDQHNGMHQVSKTSDR